MFVLRAGRGHGRCAAVAGDETTDAKGRKNMITSKTDAIAPECATLAKIAI
jgi:hypothetical protein